jgi:hypothetical protein
LWGGVEAYGLCNRRLRVQYASVYEKSDNTRSRGGDDANWHVGMRSSLEEFASLSMFRFNKVFLGAFSLEIRKVMRLISDE